MTKRDRMGVEMTHHDLDDLFAQLRSTPPEPSVALLARIAGDAGTHQPRPAMPVRPKARVGFWAGLADVLGGKVAMTGLATATIAGILIGYTQPLPVTGLGDGLWLDASALEAVELIPDFDAFLVEG